MINSKLKTTIQFIPSGKKKAKEYDAVVVEGVKGKHIVVEVADVATTPIKLLWDKSLYKADMFGNKISCEYTIEGRDFTANKIPSSGGVSKTKSTVVSRSRSGRPGQGGISNSA